MTRKLLLCAQSGASSPIHDDCPRTPSAILSKHLQGKREVEMSAFKNHSPEEPQTGDVNENVTKRTAWLIDISFTGIKCKGEVHVWYRRQYTFLTSRDSRARDWYQQNYGSFLVFIVFLKCGIILWLFETIQIEAASFCKAL